MRKRYETCTTDGDMDAIAERNRPAPDPDTWALVAAHSDQRWTYFYWQREIEETEAAK